MGSEDGSIKKAVFLECTHGTIVFDEDMGEEICGGCGTVITQKIETIEYHSKEEMNLREGGLTRSFSSPATLLPAANRSQIGKKNIDYSGTAVHESTFGQRHRTLDNQCTIHATQEKNFSKAHRVFVMLQEKIKAPRSVTDRAIFMYRKAFAKQLTRGRTIPGIAGACMYLAAKEYNMPVVFDEIQNAVNPEVKSRNFNRNSIKQYVRLLKDEIGVQQKRVTPHQYVSKIISECEASPAVHKRAIEILNMIDNAHFTQGKSPSGLASSAIYIAAIECDAHISQVRIAVSGDISTASMRKRIYEIIDYAKLDVKILERNNWQSKGAVPETVRVMAANMTG